MSFIIPGELTAIDTTVDLSNYTTFSDKRILHNTHQMIAAKFEESSSIIKFWFMDGSAAAGISLDEEKLYDFCYDRKLDKYYAIGYDTRFVQRVDEYDNTTYTYLTATGTATYTDIDQIITTVTYFNQVDTDDFSEPEGSTDFCSDRWVEWGQGEAFFRSIGNDRLEFPELIGELTTTYSFDGDFSSTLETHASSFVSESERFELRAVAKTSVSSYGTGVPYAPIAIHGVGYFSGNTVEYSTFVTDFYNYTENQEISGLDKFTINQWNCVSGTETVYVTCTDRNEGISSVWTVSGTQSGVIEVVTWSPGSPSTVPFGGPTKPYTFTVVGNYNDVNEGEWLQFDLHNYYNTADISDITLSITRIGSVFTSPVIPSGVSVYTDPARIQIYGDLIEDQPSFVWADNFVSSGTENYVISSGTVVTGTQTTDTVDPVYTLSGTSTYSTVVTGTTQDYYQDGITTSGTDVTNTIPGTEVITYSGTTTSTSTVTTTGTCGVVSEVTTEDVTTIVSGTTEYDRTRVVEDFTETPTHKVGLKVVEFNPFTGETVASGISNLELFGSGVTNNYLTYSSLGDINTVHIACDYNGPSSDQFVYLRHKEKIYKYKVDDFPLTNEDGNNAVVSSTGQMPSDTSAISFNWMTTAVSGVLTYSDYDSTPGIESLFIYALNDATLQKQTDRKLILDASSQDWFFFNQLDFDTLYYIGGAGGVNLLEYNVDDNMAAFIAVNADDTIMAAGTGATTTLTAEIINAYGDPLNGKSVTFAVTAGYGTITGDNPVTTSGGGIATTEFTVGSEVGSATVTATVVEL